MKFLLSSFLLLPFAAIAADTDALSTLIPAYGEIPPTFWEQNRTIVIIDIIVFLAVAVVVTWEIFRPRPTPVLPPEKIARDALARLQEQVEDGKLLSDVARILRGYFGKQFQIPGEEATTMEFIAGLERNKPSSVELKQAIDLFLRECDGRKFSPTNPAQEMDAVERALDLVNAAEKWRLSQLSGGESAK